MNGHDVDGRIARAAVVAAAALSIAVLLAPGFAAAGIVRDVMVSIGVAKPKPPTPGAPGSQALPRAGFACCVLHYSKDWINDGNYADLPMIPAGTPIEVLSYGSNRAYVKVEGKPMRLGHDYGREQETLEQWVAKIVVNEDPRPRFAKYPAPVQEAIRTGKVMIGMTREQAIAAVGYPLTSENVSLNAPTWRLWRSSHGEYQLNWGANGRLKSVTGDEAIAGPMIHQPGR